MEILDVQGRSGGSRPGHAPFCAFTFFLGLLHQHLGWQATSACRGGSDGRGSQVLLQCIQDRLCSLQTSFIGRIAFREALHCLQRRFLRLLVLFQGAIRIRAQHTGRALISQKAIGFEELAGFFCHFQGFRVFAAQHVHLRERAHGGSQDLRDTCLLLILGAQLDGRSRRLLGFVQGIPGVLLQGLLRSHSGALDHRQLHRLLSHQEEHRRFLHGIFFSAQECPGAFARPDGCFVLFLLGINLRQQP
mmetsp:Transcript_25277/g.41015  ORF Transcript_25277/g.41015 Transcript_25277/m.41015 type:complete len:247 (-) Transcript_25277:1233-1973(-)